MLDIWTMDGHFGNVHNIESCILDMDMDILDPDTGKITAEGKAEGFRVTKVSADDADFLNCDGCGGLLSCPPIP